MSPLKLFSRVLIGALTFVLLPVSNRGQGVPWYTIPLPVPNGFVDVVTGNVHLEIPLGSMPQRNGDPIVSKMIYDTTSYTYTSNWFPSTPGHGWQPNTGSSHAGYAHAIGSGETCTAFGLGNYPNGSVSFWGGFSFTDLHGTIHSLGNDTGSQTRQVNCYDNFGNPFGNSMDITSINLTIGDAAAYSLQVTNYNQIQVWAADGTLVADDTTDQFSSDKLPVDMNGNTGIYRNGNTGQGSAPNLSSGLPVGILCPGNPLNYSGTSTVTTSSGSSATYTFTCTAQSVSQVLSGTTYVNTLSLLTSLAGSVKDFV